VLTKILITLVFIATNILSYNVGYLQALSDFYGQLREEIHWERDNDIKPRKGPAATYLST